MVSGVILRDGQITHVNHEPAPGETCVDDTREYSIDEHSEYGFPTLLLRVDDIAQGAILEVRERFILRDEASVFRMS